MPNVNDIFWELSLGGTFLGIIVFLWAIYRDGLAKTVEYWINPVDFSGPVECYSSMISLSIALKNPPRPSIPKIIFALFCVLFCGALTGFLIGGFCLIAFYTIIESIINIL